jgi:hypothetical protein
MTTLYLAFRTHPREAKESDYDAIVSFRGTPTDRASRAMSSAAARYLQRYGDVAAMHSEKLSSGKC